MPSTLPVRREMLFFALSILLVGFYVWRADSLHAIGYPLDDAWIHQVFARNLAESGEWAFVPGEPSAASTAPLYTVLLSVSYGVGLPHFLWTHFLGVLALTLVGSMAAILGEQLFPNRRGVGLLTGLAVMLEWHVVWAASAGMETALFMGFSLAVLVLAFRETESERALDTRSLLMRGLALGAVGGLLTLTRPEGIGLVGLVGLFGMLSFGLGRRYGLWAVGIAIGWLVVISPYTLWNYNLTGELLPVTADAKIAENAPLREASLFTRYLNLIVPLSAGAQFMALPALLWGVWLVMKRARENRRLWLLLVPLVWACAHLTVFALRLPAPYQHGRYVMPILPPLLIFVGGGLLDMFTRFNRTPIQRILSRTLVIGSLAAFPAFLWIGGGAYANGVRIINTEMVETAKWVRDNVPDDALFAVHDIGALGYFAPRDILDTAGLVSPEVTPFFEDQAAMMNYICEREARWLMVLPDQRPVPADDPRLTLAYESPYNFASEAQGIEGDAEPWKMRVYRLNCP